MNTPKPTLSPPPQRIQQPEPEPPKPTPKPVLAAEPKPPIRAIDICPDPYCGSRWGGIQKF